MKQKLFLTFCCCFIASVVFAQQRNCHTMQNLEYRQIKNPSVKDKMEQIEKFTQQKIGRLDGDSRNIVGDVIKIPVVVHVIYRNDDENISMEQIQSQIDVINEDFRRTNADQTSDWAQATDTKIEFYLSQIDPNGNLTNGVTRKFSTRDSWGTNDDMKRSSQGGVDPWNTSEYLNMWVCNIGGGVLGYAQFPGGEADTDGVVMGPEFFGSSDKGSGFYLSPPFDKGRTTTHEIGHFLNLRHIWGDGGCGVDDFVADTPESDAPNFGCASTHESCGSLDMVQNYMDYSDDACMNLYTVGQRDRMRAILEEGGIRHDLALSDKTSDLSCSATIPTGLSVSDITYEQATISWTEVENASYELRYRPVGTTAWFSETATTIPAIIEGLDGETEYEVQVKSICPTEDSEYSSVITFTTPVTPPMYCESGGSNVSDEYIQAVQLGAINNVSETNTGYSDYTAISTTLEMDVEHTITITPEWPGTVYSEGYGVYIDYNQDLDFDDIGEEVFVAAPSTTSPVVGTFTIPSDALEGATRMRVVLRFNSNAEPCGTFLYGETEDYTVIIGGGDTESPTAPLELEASNVSFSSLTLNWNPSTDNVGVTAYDVYQDDNLVATVSDTTVDIENLTPRTRYTFYVVAKDAAGNVSDPSASIRVKTKRLRYCRSKGRNAAYEWIDLVKFGGMRNRTKSDAGYANFTNKVANVQRGTTNKLVVSAGFRTISYLEYWAVWIDFNQDGDFDDDEKVLTGSSSKDKNLRRWIDIPMDAKLGKTRMRVSMKNDAPQTACEKFAFGEVEDYSVVIQEFSGRGTNQNTVVIADSNEEVLGNEIGVSVSVFPNPAQDIIQVNLREKVDNATYRILNPIGKVILDSKKLNNVIDVSNLKSGIYFIEIHDTQKVLTSKFVKR